MSVFNFTTALELSKNDKQILVYDIGYQNLNVKEFIQLISDYDIEYIADIREKPFSKKIGFSKNDLEKISNVNHLIYENYVKLGAPSVFRYDLRKSGNYSLFFQNYRNYLNYQINSLEKLLKKIKLFSTLLLCFENDYQKCHRSIIMEYLSRYRINSVHL